MADNILAEMQPTKYHEAAEDVNFEEFRKVVESRRSVRVYEPTPIPDEDVWTVFDMTLLAPNSSNLQPWEFYWVKNPEKKSKLAEACMGQKAATTAPVLIVCVARPNHWNKHSKQMLKVLGENAPVPKLLKIYYSKVTPMAYRVGLFGLIGVGKWLTLTIAGMFRVVPRGPLFYSQLREWAVKTTALACENMMLAFRALGYDSCPMEGFDEVRVKKLLNLPGDAHVVMVISAGKRSYHGVYGPRVRFPREQFVKVVE